MEKSVGSFHEYLEAEFQIKGANIKTYSPLTFAYIGDAIYDLLIRTLIVKRGNCSPNKLHKRTSQLVKASAQAELIDKIMPALTEEERNIYKRGCNAKPHTIAKNATAKDYQKATGLEAMVGYLYLQDDVKRIIDLLKLGLTEEEQ